jgi:hypothetical protein
MNSIQDIKDLADLRFKEAQILLANGCPDGAYYLGGYALELALKAVICKNWGVDDLFADSNQHPKEAIRVLKVHDFHRLLLFSGLLEKHKVEKLSPHFSTNWSNVEKWSEAARYNKSKYTTSEVQIFMNSMDDPSNGIFTWIKKHW